MNRSRLRFAATVALLGLLPVEAPAQGEPPRGMVFVPSGSFTMGDDVAKDESPVHQRELAGFYIDRTEVTIAQYRRFRPHYLALEGRERHPVVNVTWADARDYCRSVGKRLPTEAEWEKACRGNDGRSYPWGDDVFAGALNAIEANAGGTDPVGSHPRGASPYGALDMAGNVWEWVADWYGPYPGAAVQQPTQEFEKYRVIRGGSFAIKGKVGRCANRFVSDPKLDSADIGFRCARSR